MEEKLVKYNKCCDKRNRDMLFVLIQCKYLKYRNLK